MYWAVLYKGGRDSAAGRALFTAPAAILAPFTSDWAAAHLFAFDWRGINKGFRLAVFKVWKLV